MSPTKIKEDAIMKVREVMTPYPITLASDEPVMKAAQAMR